MSAQEIVLTFIALFLVCVVVVAANHADSKNSRRARKFVIGMLMLFNVLMVVTGGLGVLSAYSPNTTDPPGKGAAWGSLLASLVTTGLTSLLLLRPVLDRLVVLFPRYQKKKNLLEPDLAAQVFPTYAPQPDSLQPQSGNTPLFPQMLNYYTADSIIVLRPSPAGSGPAGVGESITADEVTFSETSSGFNPASAMHMTALFLCVYMLGLQMVNFIAAGGLEGVAKSYKGGLTVWDILINELPFLVIPVLGVGMGMRRNLKQTLKRLGLGMPSVEGLMVSAGTTIALFVFVVIVGSIWMGLVSKETYKKQTEASDAISKSITTLGLAFAVAASAAIGEEIAFRGALQPIFGLWPTAIIFALTHAQYALTPASLIILGVALAFGWIRQRYNTTVAMVTHFWYDFIPLAASAAVSSGVLVWLLRLL